MNNLIIHHIPDALFCRASEDYFLFGTVHTATFVFCVIVTHCKIKWSTCHGTDQMARVGLELEDIVPKYSLRTRSVNVLTRTPIGGEGGGTKRPLTSTFLPITKN